MPTWKPICARSKLSASVYRCSGRKVRSAILTYFSYPLDRRNSRHHCKFFNWSVFAWGKNLNDDDTGLDVLRYIDSRGIPGPAGVSTRGFAVTLPKPRQFGITGSYKF